MEGRSAGEYVVGNDLFIVQAYRSHAGRYMCTANNDVGKPAAAEAKVTINCKCSIYCYITDSGDIPLYVALTYFEVSLKAGSHVQRKRSHV